MLSAAIEKQFMARLAPDSAIKTVSESLASVSLSSLAPAPAMLSPLTTAPASPPLSLLDYPPLAHVTNR